MALLPKVSLSLKPTCDKVDICEETGVYSTANTGGWGSPNIPMTDTISAIVDVYDSGGTSLTQSFIIKQGITDLFPSSGISPFQAFSDSSWTQGDGIYKIVYSVVNKELTTAPGGLVHPGMGVAFTAAINTYTNVPSTSSGSGTGAIFTVDVSPINVLNQLTVTTTGNGYEVGDTITIQGSDLGGGGGTIVITLAATMFVTTTYTNNTQYLLTMCSLENCMEKLVGKLVEECDAIKLEKYKTTLDQLEVLKYGVKTAFSCKNFTRATTLLTNAATICTTFSGCDCTCSCDC